MILKKLFALGAKIWIRIPVIPGINDSAQDMQQLRDFLQSAGKPEKIQLLPYHAMGENKYEAIGKQPQRFLPPDKNKLLALEELFG